MMPNSSKAPAQAPKGRGSDPKTTARTRRPSTPGRRIGFGVGLALVAASLAAAAFGVFQIVGSSAGASNPDQLWRDAQTCLHENRIDDAERALARLTRARAPLPQDWMLRGQVAVARERIDEAIDALAKVDGGGDIEAQARLLAGQVELRRDRARFAEAAFLEALRLNPSLPQARRELIYTYGMQLRRREICEQFAALSEISALEYENLFHWGLMRNCQWEAGEVAQKLSAYLAADPDDRESRLALADNNRRLGLYAEAEEALAPLPEDDPRAMAHRVMILMDRREEDRAEELLKKGPPNDPELARLRGRVALAHRDGPQALRYYRIAYDADPANRDAIFGLINAYELCGERAKAGALRRKGEALEAFNSLVQRMATETGRTDPGIVQEAVRVCIQAGFIPEARAWLKFAIGKNPLDAESQQALFRLKKSAPIPRSAPPAAPRS